jgi:hypothetical protein
MKYIKNFESSYFHTMEDIDEILDKISKSGYKSLSDSDRAILLNYSKDDSDIHAILVKLNELFLEYFELKKKVSVLLPSDSDEMKEKVKNDLIRVGSKLEMYENMLKYLYKIEDTEELGNYMKKSGIIENNNNVHFLWCMKTKDFNRIEFYYDSQDKVSPLKTIKDFDSGKYWSIDCKLITGSFYKDDPDEDSFCLIPKNDVIGVWCEDLDIKPDSEKYNL